MGTKGTMADDSGICCRLETEYSNRPIPRAKGEVSSPDTLLQISTLFQRACAVGRQLEKRKREANT